MSDPHSLALRAKMLGAMVREARELAGKSMREAAERIGVSTSTYSSYEHGRKAISLPELEVLALDFGVPLERFWSAQPEDLQPKADFDPKTMILLRQKMIGAQLRAHRQADNRTLVDIGKATDISPSRISAYERGERPLPLPELQELAEALGRPLEDYLDEEGPVGEWQAEQKVSEKLSQLPDDLVDFLMQPESETYLRLARDLGKLGSERLRSVAQALLELTP